MQLSLPTLCLKKQHWCCTL